MLAAPRLSSRLAATPYTSAASTASTSPARRSHPRAHSHRRPRRAITTAAPCPGAAPRAGSSCITSSGARAEATTGQGTSRPRAAIITPRSTTATFASSAQRRMRSASSVPATRPTRPTSSPRSGPPCAGSASARRTSRVPSFRRASTWAPTHRSTPGFVRPSAHAPGQPRHRRSERLRLKTPLTLAERVDQNRAHSARPEQRRAPARPVSKSAASPARPAPSWTPHRARRTLVA